MKQNKSAKTKSSGASVVASNTNKGNASAENTDCCKSKENIQSKPPDLGSLKYLLDFITNETDLATIKNAVVNHINGLINKKEELSSKYHFIFLYDDINSINEDMADKIYDAIPKDSSKPILFVLHSRGGEVEPAYLISKACKENTSEFVIVIPRRAKSAATLISLGAAAIHMGSMSELGPIDPQFGRLPALSISSSLNTIAKVVSEQPKAGDMFAKYLSEKLDLRILGYFERVSESAEQYAQRLLVGKKTPKDIKEIAHDLVYEYKDHSFVIDKEEAKKYLGDIIKINSEEYNLASQIHKFLRDLILVMNIRKRKNVTIVGKLEDLYFEDVKTNQ